MEARENGRILPVLCDPDGIRSERPRICNAWTLALADLMFLSLTLCRWSSSFIPGRTFLAWENMDLNKQTLLCEDSSHCHDSVVGGVPTALCSIQVALLSPTTAPEDSPKISRSPLLFLEESHRWMASRGVGGVLVSACVVCRKAWTQSPIVYKPGMVNEHLQSSYLRNGNRKIKILCNLTFFFIQTTSEQTHQLVPRLDVTDHVTRWCHSRNYITKGRLTACLASLTL